MKQIFKNKKGSAMTWAVVIIAFMLVIGGGFFVVKGGYLQSITPDGSPSPEKCADSTGILYVNNYSALVGGTDPGAMTFSAGILQEGEGATDVIVAKSVTPGTTTFAVGDKLVIFGSIANYLDKYEVITMGCGGATLDFPIMYSTSDNPSIRIKNDDGDFMSNAIGGLTTNQTSLSAGETLNLEVEIQGTNGESSGEGVYIVEFPASSNANISSVTLDGKSPIALPTVHTSLNAGSKIVAFDVPAVEGSTKKTMTLSVSLVTGKILNGGVYTDFYSKQWFIDDNKKLAYGIEDSDGTLKYENTVASDFFINAP